MLDFTRLENLRKTKGWSEAQLAARCNFGRTKINDWKRGKAKPKDCDIALIASFLDTTPEYLKGETNIKEKPATISDDGLTEEQYRLVKLFDAAPPELQKAALAVLESREALDKDKDTSL